MISLKLTLFLSVVTLAATAPTVHIFPVIGQSNSIGSNSDGHTDEDVTYDNILQTSCCVNGAMDNDKCQLISGQDPLRHQCEDWYVNSQIIGFGMSFARQLHAKMATDDVIVLVPAGLGGTGFFDNVWTAYNGSGFQQAVKRLEATFDLVSVKYPNHVAIIGGYLWHQGELDALIGTSIDDYLNKDIIPMISAFRDPSLIPQSNAQVPFIVGNMLPVWAEDKNQTERLGVLVALQVLDQYVPYTMVVPSQGLVGDPSELPAPIHFTGKSQRLLGKRYYAAWEMAFLNNVL